VNQNIIRATVLAGVFGVILLFASSPPAVAGALDDWEFSREITLTGAYPENYQMKMFFDAQDNLDDNISFADFRDLRFTENSDDSVILDYWVENYNDNDNVILWVRLPQDNTDNSIYIWWKNTAATSYSSGENTFYMFENYDSAPVEGDKWYFNDQGSGDNVWEADGTFRIQNANLLEVGFWSVDNFVRPFAVEFDIKLENNVPSGNYPWLGIKDHDNWNETPDYNDTGLNPRGDGAFNILWPGTGSPDTGLDWNDGEWERWGQAAYENGGTTFDNNRAGLNHVDDWSNMVHNPLTSTDTTQKIGFDGFAYPSNGMFLDNIIVRAWTETPPTYTIATAANQISIAIPTADNILIDRDQDNDNTTPILSTQISVQITQLTAGENVDTFGDNYVSLFVRDNNGDFVIDNWQPVSSTIIDNVTKEFTFDVYNPSDSLDNTALGGFSVSVVALDNFGTGDNSGYDEVFQVDDLTSVALSREIKANHINRIYSPSAIARVSAAATPVIINAWLVDNNVPSFEANIVSNDSIDDNYAPADAGYVYGVFETAELDGQNPSFTYYTFPNISPAFVSMSFDNALIDNHASDNGVTTTLIEFVIKDDDNYDDFNDDFWGSPRDANDIVFDNDKISLDNITFENEKFAVISVLFDAENYDFFGENFGQFDYGVSASDNWSFLPVAHQAAFTVDELVVPINFTPDFPYSGFTVTVSGTTYRLTGAGLTIDNHKITDEKQGIIWTGSGNSYSENYSISGVIPGENIDVEVIAIDGALDGENSLTYTVNENQQFRLFIRFEENYELVDWIPDNNRPVTVGWSEGIDPITLTSNPENIIVSASENFAENIFVTDNGAYLRRNVLETYGGDITLVIVGNPQTVGGTSFGDVDQFTLFLQDLTGLYEPPKGIISIRSWIGENLAIIHQDYWGVDFRIYPWLITGTRYQIWVDAENVPVRALAPIDAVESINEKTIQITPITGDPEEIYYEIYWSASRTSDNVIRIEYLDNLAETITASVTIYDYAGTELDVFAPDNEWFVITYSQANPNMSYSVVLEFTHETYSAQHLSSQIAGVPPPGVQGIGNPFNLPNGVTLAALGSFIVITMIALAFDSTRMPIGILAMTLMAVFCWTMRWLPLPGPYNGAFTASMFIVAAVLVILTWRHRR